MKYQLSILILLLSTVLQPLLSVNARQEIKSSNHLALPSNSSEAREESQNDVRLEAPGLLVADNLDRRIEFTQAGLRFVARREAGSLAFEYRLKSLTWENEQYLASEDQQAVLPVSEDNEVFYSHSWDILEEYKVHRRSVDQRFVLMRELDLNGNNLKISGKVMTDLRGENSNNESPGGITFYSGREPILRYSTANIVDGGQRRIQVEPRLKGSRIAIAVEGTWLRQATYPVVISVLIEDLLPSRAMVQNEAVSANSNNQAGTGNGIGGGGIFPAGISHLIIVQTPIPIPALVLGLRHNLNQEREGLGFTVSFSAPANSAITRMDGGDLGADLHRGYEWWMVNDNPGGASSSVNLPPGVVFALKHSPNQAGQDITAFGRDPVSGPSSFPKFSKQVGGDLGGHPGEGYYWYESTGDGFSDWNSINDLPKYIVLGLKHSTNQHDKTFTWNGRVFDPANPRIAPPPGFVREVGGDIKADSGQGYFWYEKITGPELVTKPSLSAFIGQSLVMNLRAEDRLLVDRDYDCLVDSKENALANFFRPYCVFDSNEIARQDFEPVALFQVRPMITPTLTVRIKWVFLFRRDGGYGPASSCSDAHEGDNDSAYYDLESSDGGRTWNLIRVGLGDRGLEWPTNSRMEVFDITHPIIYMSGSKHHEYFTRDRDLHDSLYSDFGCNDNVNGKGFKTLVDLKNLTSLLGPRFNNVGEPESHVPPFVNDLNPRYPGFSAWGNENFYGVGPIREKWITDPINCP